MHIIFTWNRTRFSWIMYSMQFMILHYMLAHKRMVINVQEYYISVILYSLPVIAYTKLSFDMTIIFHIIETGIFLPRYTM